MVRRGSPRNGCVSLQIDYLSLRPEHRRRAPIFFTQSGTARNLGGKVRVRMLIWKKSLSTASSLRRSFGPGRVDRHDLGASHFRALVLSHVGSRDQSAGALIQLLPLSGQQKVDKQSGCGGVRRLRDEAYSDHETRQRAGRNPIDRRALLL